VSFYASNVYTVGAKSLTYESSGWVSRILLNRNYFFLNMTESVFLFCLYIVKSLGRPREAYEDLRIGHRFNNKERPIKHRMNGSISIR